MCASIVHSGESARRSEMWLLLSFNFLTVRFYDSILVAGGGVWEEGKKNGFSVVYAEINFHHLLHV